MALQVIEGTWEEIERHKADFAGRQLRLIVTDLEATNENPSTASSAAALQTKPRVLTAFGAFKGKVGSSEEFAREKQMELDREERRL